METLASKYREIKGAVERAHQRHVAANPGQPFIMDQDPDCLRAEGFRAALGPIRHETVVLEADVEYGDLGILTHPRTAKELLRLDTIERRRRAVAEGATLTNIRGFVPSGNVRDAVTTLLRLIADGRESDEMYGESFAREAREKEAEIRKLTGNPSAIYNPFKGR